MDNLQGKINELMVRLKKAEINSLEFSDESDSIVSFHSDSDGLSQVSDISSLDSFDFTEKPRKIIQINENKLFKKGNTKNTNNSKKVSSPHKPRKSKLPIRKGSYSPTRINNSSDIQRLNSSPYVPNQKKTAKTPDYSLKRSNQNSGNYSNPNLIASDSQKKLSINNNYKKSNQVSNISSTNHSDIFLSRKTNSSINEPQYDIQQHQPRQIFDYSNQLVTNLFEPHYSNYKYIFIGFYQGKDYPKSELGQRNTYIQLFVHPNLPEITTKVVYNTSNNIDYHFGCNLFCEGLDFHFTNFTPVLSVFDLITSEKVELIGKAYPQFQTYHHKNGICYIYEKEWINLVSSARTICGKVCITIAFHNDDNFQPSYDKPEQNLENSNNKNVKKVTLLKNQVPSQHITSKKNLSVVESNYVQNSQSSQEGTIDLEGLSLSYGQFSNSQLIPQTNNDQKNILTIMNDEENHDREHLKFLGTLDLEESADILPSNDDVPIPQWVDSENGLENSDSEPLSTSVTHYIINSPDDPPSPLRDKYLRYKDFGFKTAE